MRAGRAFNGTGNAATMNVDFVIELINFVTLAGGIPGVVRACTLAQLFEPHLKRSRRWGRGARQET